ncbi:hypothetical protein K474DRAFT_1708026 [Panus rudis PR-1116 ss-1]|nr:hypothetical protein K474DRAFT_1708026 [Panus rudis PR-1116 ss-1]
MPAHTTRGVSSSLTVSSAPRRRGREPPSFTSRNALRPTKRRTLGPVALGKRIRDGDNEWEDFNDSINAQEAAALADFRNEPGGPSQYRKTPSSDTHEEMAGHMQQDENMPLDSLLPELSEEDGFAHAVTEMLAAKSRSSRKDKRSYRDRLQSRNSHWAPLLPSLVEAYLQWKYPPSSGKSSSVSDDTDTTLPHPAQVASEDHSQTSPSVPNIWKNMQLSNMYQRTGAKVCLIVVRGDSTAIHKPFLYYTSERVVNSFNLVVKQSLEKVAIHMEGYCLSGLHGITKNYTQQVIDLKSRVVDIIRQKLLEATNNRCKRMNYASFEDISYEFGLAIDGWPLPAFCKPSSVTSRIEVQTLLSCWESNATKFRALSKPEHEAYKRSYEEGSAPLLVGLNGQPSAIPSAGGEAACQEEGGSSATDAVGNGPSAGDKRTADDAAIGEEGRVVRPKKTRKTRADKGRPRGKKKASAPGTVTTDNAGNTAGATPQPTPATPPSTSSPSSPMLRSPASTPPAAPSTLSPTVGSSTSPPAHAATSTPPTAELSQPQSSHHHPPHPRPRPRIANAPPSPPDSSPRPSDASPCPPDASPHPPGTSPRPSSLNTSTHSSRNPSPHPSSLMSLLNMQGPLPAPATHQVEPNSSQAAQASHQTSPHPSQLSPQQSGTFQPASHTPDAVSMYTVPPVHPSFFPLPPFFTPSLPPPPHSSLSYSSVFRSDLSPQHHSPSGGSHYGQPYTSHNTSSFQQLFPPPQQSVMQHNHHASLVAAGLSFIPYIPPPP